MYTITEIQARSHAAIYYAQLRDEDGLVIQAGRTYYFIAEATEEVLTVDTPTWQRYGMQLGLVELADAQHAQDLLARESEKAQLLASSLLQAQMDQHWPVQEDAV